MRKFTIFTILFSVVTVAIVAELFTNDFFGEETNVEPGSLQTNIVGNEPRPAARDISLSNEILQNIGFLQPRITPISFNGKLFQILDLRDDSEIGRIVKSNVFDGDQFIFSVYEIQNESEGLASDTYSFIQEKFLENLEVEVNETNQYGDASFYVNHPKKQNMAFLFVEIDTTLYAFEYPRNNHNFITSLIGSIKNFDGSGSDTLDNSDL